MNCNRNCLVDLLSSIDSIQKSVTSLNDEGCLRPMTTSTTFNTRPVTFYTCNNTQLTLTYYVDGTPTTSDTFRIENVNDDCVTVRLLAEAAGTFTSTNETAIINIDCICAVMCLDDITLIL